MGTSTELSYAGIAFVVFGILVVLAVFAWFFWKVTRDHDSDGTIRGFLYRKVTEEEEDNNNSLVALQADVAFWSA